MRTLLYNLTAFFSSVSVQTVKVGSLFIKMIPFKQLAQINYSLIYLNNQSFVSGTLNVALYV